MKRVHIKDTIHILSMKNLVIHYLIKKVLRNKMRGMKSKNLNLISYESNKTSTSYFDDKRYILNDGINTLPYGHKDIPK